MAEIAMIRMIGNRIRKQRKAQHLSLRQLAKRAGLSNALLSKIENGKVASPISTYIKITEALGIAFGDLVEINQAQDLLYLPDITRQADGKGDGNEQGYRYEPIGSGWPNDNFDAFIVSYRPTKTSPPRLTSDVDAFLFVVEGQIEFFHGDQSKLLKAGDSLIINANIPHGGRAFGGHQARGILLTIKRG